MRIKPALGTVQSCNEDRIRQQTQKNTLKEITGSPIVREYYNINILFYLLMETGPFPGVRIVSVQSHEGFRLNWKSYRDVAFWKLP